MSARAIPACQRQFNALDYLHQLVLSDVIIAGGRPVSFEASRFIAGLTAGTICRFEPNNQRQFLVYDYLSQLVQSDVRIHGGLGPISRDALEHIADWEINASCLRRH